MERFIRPLALLVAALLVAAGVGLVLRTGDDGTYDVTAYFTKAIGLYENSDVTILGVAVGKITDVAPEGERVRVELEIDDRYKVPVDARAQIVPISVISDRYVELFPLYQGGPTLPDGAVLDTDRTQIPAELDDVFKQLKKLLDAIEPGQEGDPGALGELIVQLNEALKDREQDLKGTLITGAELTQTLAQADEDISGLLTNLDDLFARLSTRATSIGPLNRNFAVVMTTLAQSRHDLEAMLANLGGMTNEVGRLLRDNRTRLGEDLRLATRITSAILRHRQSVEESLTWLPVVAENLAAAHHGPPFRATDVRDNPISARCDDFKDLPAPIRDLVSDLYEHLCGQPPPRGERVQPQAPQVPAPVPPLQELNCEQSVKRVKRQIDRITRIDSVPRELLDDVVKPLRKKLKQVAQRCDELEDALEDPDSALNQLLEELTEEIGGVPELEDTVDELDSTVDDLTGNAAAPRAAGGRGDRAWSKFSGWVGGLLRFVGWSA